MRDRSRGFLSVEDRREGQSVWLEGRLYRGKVAARGKRVERESLKAIHDGGGKAELGGRERLLYLTLKSSNTLEKPQNCGLILILEFY